MSQKKMFPLLSIIMPIYNAEEYLNRCIDSILNQTMRDFELILVDDGSMDSSRKICKLYLDYDKRIKFICKKNGGVSSARNEGIKFATGQYITFIDPDDWIDFNMYEIMLNTIKMETADIVVCDFCTEPNAQLLESKNKIISLFTPLEAIKDLCKGNGLHNSVWNKIYVNSFIKNVTFNENISIGEDWLFNLFVFNKVGIVAYTNQKFYHYFSHENSVMNQKSYEKISASLQEIKNIVKKLHIDHSRLATAVHVGYYTMIYIYISDILDSTDTYQSKKLKYDEYRKLYKEAGSVFFFKQEIPFYRSLLLFTYIMLPFFINNKIRKIIRCAKALRKQ